MSLARPRFALVPPRCPLSALTLLTAALIACSSPQAPVSDGGTEPLPDAGIDAPTDALAEIPADAPAEAGPCALVSPYSSKNKPCNACAEDKCCAEVNGCVGDPACNDDYVICTIACALDYDGGTDAGTVDCLDDCGKQYPRGKAAYDLAIGCVENACPTECQ